MNIILWIIFGGIAGWIASLIMNTSNQQGLLANVIIGIFGALLGGWLMNFLGESGVSGFDLYSFIVALFGSVVLLAIAKFFRFV